MTIDELGRIRKIVRPLPCPKCAGNPMLYVYHSEDDNKSFIECGNDNCGYEVEGYWEGRDFEFFANLLNLKM